MQKAFKVVFFLFLTLVLLFAGAYFFFGKQYLGKKSKAQLAPTFAWEFDRDGQLEGWSGVGFSEGVVTKGGNLLAFIRNIKPTTVFPTLLSPFFKLEAKNFNRLEVRMKVVTNSVVPTPTSTPSSNIITGVKASAGKPFILTVSFSNQQAKIDDWIGLANAQANASAIDERAYLDWKWLNNNQQLSRTLFTGSGQVTFENVQPGNYVVRYYTRKNTSPWPWEILATNPITVGEEPMLGRPVSNIAPMPPITEGVKGSMLLLFGPSNSDYSGKQSMKIETTENNEFNTYVFDLSKNADWQGLISQIKLVPTFNTQRTIFIDWIRFSAAEQITPPPVKTELPVTEFGTVVEQSLVSSIKTNVVDIGLLPEPVPGKGILGDIKTTSSSTNKNLYNVSVAFANNKTVNPFPSVTDWVGIYKSGAADTVYIDWRYLNNTKNTPQKPIDSGNLTFENITNGSYEVRYFFNNGYKRLDAKSFVVPTATPTPIPTKPPQKKSYSLKTDDGRIYPLTQTAPISPPCEQGKPCMVIDPLPPEIYFGQFVGKTVLVEGTMKQNLLFKCQTDASTNCQPPSIVWWPLPNRLVFEVKRIQLAQKGYDTTVLGFPSGYIQNATISYAGENVYVLKMQQVQLGVTENENKRNMPIQKELYVRSSYDDLAPLIGKLVSLKGQMFTVGTTQIMNLSSKGVITSPPGKALPLKK